MIVILAALLASPATTSPEPSPALLPACQQGKLQPAKGTRRGSVHKLNQEPPARQLYTVLRTEDGCTKPVYVNDRVIDGARR